MISFPTLLLLAGTSPVVPQDDPVAREVIALPGAGCLLVDLDLAGRTDAYAASLRHRDAYWGTGEFDDAEAGERGFAFRLSATPAGSRGAYAFVSVEPLAGRSLEQAARDTVEELPTRVEATRLELAGQPSAKKGRKRDRFEDANETELDVWRVRYSVERNDKNYAAEMSVMVFGDAVLRVSVEDEPGGADHAELFPSMLRLIEGAPPEIARTTRHHESPGGDRRFVECAMPRDMHSVGADLPRRARRSWSIRGDDGRWTTRLSLFLHYEKEDGGLAAVDPIFDALVRAPVDEYLRLLDAELEPLPAVASRGRRVAFLAPTRTTSARVREVRVFLIQDGVVWEWRLESWVDRTEIPDEGNDFLADGAHPDDALLAEVLATFTVR